MAAAQPQTRPATGTETVTVACKIPQGFILQLHEPRDLSEVTMGGHRDVKQYFPVGEPFRLNGAAHGQNEGPRCRVVGGFALTDGVPKELWDKWLEQNKTLPAVVNRMLFAYPSTSHAVAAAKEVKTLKTGLERLNPNALPQIFDKKRFKVEAAEDMPTEVKESIAGHVEE